MWLSDMMEKVEDFDQVELVMEKLVSLKEIRDHQHNLQQTRGQLERCYGDYKECRDLAAQCGAELSKLEGERSRLQSRLEQIDTDLAQLTGIKRELEETCTQCVISAPTELYRRMEEQINEERRTLGMERLPQCEAYLKLSTNSSVRGLTKGGQSSHNRLDRARSARSGFPYAIPKAKAGPSYKQCPSCDQVVSRNAVTCPKCHASCSRPGHGTGKR